MSEVDDLRNTIEARRQELQDLRDQRSKVQDEAEKANSVALLKAELKSIEVEVDKEKDLLAAQKSAIDVMKESVIKAEDISDPVEEDVEVTPEIPDVIVQPEEVPEVIVVPSSDIEK